jgi:hypothetical protein
MSKECDMENDLKEIRKCLELFKLSTEALDRVEQNLGKMRLAMQRTIDRLKEAEGGKTVMNTYFRDEPFGYLERALEIGK